MKVKVKYLWIVLGLAMVSCEDDPLLEEMPSETTGGSYGKSTFENVKTFEQLEEEACDTQY